MSNLREAALDAVATYHEYLEIGGIGWLNAAMETLRAALAQPDDKAQPVAIYQGQGADQIQELLAGLEGLTYGTKLYATPQPPAAQDKAQPMAWIEHHKAGDNLNWDRVDHPYAKATPLYTATQPAARIPFAGYDPKFCPGSNPDSPQPQAEHGAELSDYPPLPKHLHTAGYLAKSPPLYTTEQMRAYVDADRAQRHVDAELSDGEIDAVWESVPDCSLKVNYEDQRKFARAVIAADRAARGGEA